MKTKTWQCASNLSTVTRVVEGDRTVYIKTTAVDGYLSGSWFYRLSLA
jgi:hypothetical protein